MLLWEEAVALQHQGKRRAKKSQPQEQELSLEDLNTKSCTKLSRKVSTGKQRRPSPLQAWPRTTPPWWQH